MRLPFCLSIQPLVTNSTRSPLCREEVDCPRRSHPVSRGSRRTHQCQLVWYWRFQCTCKLLLSSVIFDLFLTVPQAILESARSAHPAAINGNNGTPKAQAPQLLLFSANSAGSLNSQMDCFKDYTAKHPQQDRDIAYTLALRREHLPHRAFAVAKDGEFIETPIPSKAPGAAPSLAMIFSGQGAQWPGMGRELIMNNASFREDIIHMDKILQGLRVPPRWSLLGKSLT